MEKIQKVMQEIINKTSAGIQQEPQQTSTNSKRCWFSTKSEAKKYYCGEPEKCTSNGWKFCGVPADSEAIACPGFAAWEKTKRLQIKLDGILPPKFREFGFGNFKADRSEMTKQAFDVAQKYYKAKAYMTGANLLLLGSYGTGKTHLGVAIIHNATLQGKSAGFVTASNMNKGGFEEIEKRFEAMKNVDLIVIDDLASEMDNKLIANHMFSLINHRYGAEKGMVMTSNLTLKQLAETLGDRILDRITERSAVVYINDIDSFRKQKRKSYLGWLED